MGTAIKVEEVSAEDPHSDDVVSGFLSAFNRDHVGGGSWQPVRLVARADDGRVRGGLRGHIGWSWLFIDTLAVDARDRGLGVGSVLIKTGEALARTRACLGVYLWTTSFQAPEFYKRLGYREFGTLPDLPPGHVAHWMMKRFDDTKHDGATS
jgi:GNAT superfamily N-acetyltransferase